ncbi:MAG: carboxypeptidase regulatory-like domain-containing protein [Deltaproteobacteria bacterium]|nr:carboxypeptidase regulatory-like domain-containing protein [Deltaproteobacteria bacterium]
MNISPSIPKISFSKQRKSLRAKAVAIGMATACLAALGTGCSETIPMDGDDIAGTVRSVAGAEAGVWVIAETRDLATRFNKTVVTDAKGQYLLPDLPDAEYTVWVRGYGLVDSVAVEARPGQQLDLNAVLAPDAGAAAQYYPAHYWYSLLQPPASSEFPGTGEAGNGISPQLTTQQHWVDNMKENCLVCHQLGNKATRELPHRDKFDSSSEAWRDRIHRTGIGMMIYNFTLFGSKDGVNPALAMFADWSDRIAAGETPAEVPPRPTGVERNIVLTVRDWATAADGRPQFVHDEIATDKRDPRVNANGPVYGAAQFAGKSVWLDPNSHTEGEAKLRTNLTKNSEAASIGSGQTVSHVAPDSAQPHNPMMDQQGRVWNTTVNREENDQPAWCTDASTNEYARHFPMEKPIGRAAQLSVFDPKTGKIRLVDTCFGTHHLEFAFDEDNTLYLSGDIRAMGWVNTRIFDETGDSEAAVGWCPTILDTNGDGKLGEAVGHYDPVDPDKDKQILGFLYGLGANPADDSVWYAHYGQGPTSMHVPGGIFRMVKGDNPPATCNVEYYQPPVDAENGASAFNPRAVDLDTQGIAWVAFGSGHMGRFDRSKCTVFHGPTATGQQCEEGWTIFSIPAPKLRGVDTDINASWNYLMWVDQHNVLGLGKDVPIVPGTQSDSLIAFLPDEEKFVEIRVPYPMSSYFRGLDGRIDDPAAGWKGRALWTNYASWPMSHMEGSNGERQPSKLVKVQLRPSPLAK